MGGKPQPNPSAPLVRFVAGGQEKHPPSLLEQFRQTSERPPCNQLQVVHFRIAGDFDEGQPRRIPTQAQDYRTQRRKRGAVSF